MPLSALEFAQIENSRFPFGVSPKSVADTLRKIGDMVVECPIFCAVG